MKEATGGHGREAKNKRETKGKEVETKICHGRRGMEKERGCRNREEALWRRGKRARRAPCIGVGKWDGV